MSLHNLFQKKIKSSLYKSSAFEPLKEVKATTLDTSGHPTNIDKGKVSLHIWHNHSKATHHSQLHAMQENVKQSLFLVF